MRMLLLVLPAVFLSACGCSFEGAGDVMYRRGGDTLMVCDNGGFALTLEATIIEGRYAQAAGIEGTDGVTGEPVFTLTATDAGTWTSPELGDGWQRATLDRYELDHAHVQCADLETRAWWNGTAQ